MIKEEQNVYTSLTNGSHQEITVVCDSGVSLKCSKEYKKQYKTIIRDRKINDGRDICLYCSRDIKSSGRKNPNVKFNRLDDNFFCNIDSEEKAYILGWIASDGHIGKNNSISVKIHKKDQEIIFRLAGVLNAGYFYERSNPDMITLRVNSKKIVSDVCNHLGISPGKKSDCVDFPKIENNLSTWAFIRGYFDGDGSINSTDSVHRHPRCDITTNSDKMRFGISEFVKKHNIPCSVTYNKVMFSHNNALDFLSKIYDQASLKLERKYSIYTTWSSWVPSLSGSGSYGGLLEFRWNKTRKDAVAPFKERASDSGYDLTIVEKIKSIGEVELFETGIKVTPEYGWYFDMVPRSSIIKSGYVLANSVGVIDRSYTGSIKIPLIKIDKNAPDLMPGFRVVQIIPRPIIHVEFKEVLDLPTSSRNENGFGSSG